MRVDHFAFEVSNLGRSVAFYRDVLGLPLIMQQVDEEHGEAFAFLKMEGEATLELLQQLGVDGATRLGRRLRDSNSPHIAFRVDDLSATLSRLAAAGVRPFDGPLHLEDVADWAYLEDPDGNAIEFIQWLDGR